MSFTLKSIELKNMRAHEHFLFEPASEGITAISGENGAGKSTIVDLFAWCLYGTRPSGTKNRNLIKDGVDPKVKPVSVKAIINIGGIDYAIERKIITKHGASECNVWGRKPGEKEYKQVAGPAVTHVEKFIKNELGMNEKGFLTSVLIQQKQVDQIVSATPRERGAVIEELTGIASITQAIQKTNENTRALEKAASIFQVGNVDAATEKVEKQKSICFKIEDKEKVAIERFKEERDIYNELLKTSKVDEKKVSKRRNFTQEIDNLKVQIAFLKKQSVEDIEYIESFKVKYGRTVATDVSKIKQDYENKRKDLYELQSELREITMNIKSKENDLEKCQILKREFNEVDEAIDYSNKILQRIEEINNNLEKLLAEKSQFTLEIKHSKESHNHISGEEQNCPVCKSEIADPESLKKDILKDIERYKEQRKNVEKEINNLKVELEKETEKDRDAKIAIEALKQSTLLNSEMKELKKVIDNKTITFEMMKKEFKVLEDNYDKALRIDADKKSLDAAKKRSLTVNDTIKEKEEKINELQSQIESLNAPSDRSHLALLNKLDSIKEKLGKMTIEGKELRGRKTLEYERLKDYEDNLKSVEESMEKYNELAKQIEISSSSATVLSAFKADRIKHSIPTLEFFASDFLSKFTGGAFTKLSVDKSFNTFVTTSDGIVRPVAQLSGGELSSASIALRLGIAMLLNSSEKNVLILDEVLVSMDEDRSRQIMETIGSMTNSQVIFIAHNSDINSVADKTVLVSKS